MTETYKGGFSIVLCTFNGRSRLTPTLQHLKSLEIPAGFPVELIIVDNASSDGTSSFVKETWMELGEPFKLIIISESRPGKANAIETGYDNAAYKFIITVDDDNWLNKDYLVKASKIIAQHHDVGMIGGYSIGYFEGTKPEWFDEIPEAFAVGKQANENGLIKKNRPIYLWGAGLIVNTSLWKHIRQQGFTFITNFTKGKAVGEDSELCIVFQALGYSFYYSEELVLHHWIPPARMQQDYCLKMFQGFGKTSVYFDVYNIVGYKLKNRRRVISWIIYLSLLKTKIFQVHEQNKKLRYNSGEHPFVKRLKVERAKTELKELLLILPQFNKLLYSIKRNLKLKPLIQSE